MYRAYIDVNGKTVVEIYKKKFEFAVFVKKKSAVHKIGGFFINFSFVLRHERARNRLIFAYSESEASKSRLASL